MRHIFPLHGKSLLFGLIILGALGAILSRPPESPAPRTIALVVEQSGALLLQIDMTTKNGTSMVTLTAQTKAAIFVSVPQDWQRTQVRNTTLADVTAQNGMQFTRWNIPANASVTFQTTDVPDQFTIMNPSKKAMEARYRRVDLSTGAVTNHSVLLSTAPATL